MSEARSDVSMNMLASVDEFNSLRERSREQESVNIACANADGLRIETHFSCFAASTRLATSSATPRRVFTACATSG